MDSVRSVAGSRWNEKKRQSDAFTRSIALAVEVDKEADWPLDCNLSNFDKLRRTALLCLAQSIFFGRSTKIHHSSYVRNKINSR